MKHYAPPTRLASTAIAAVLTLTSTIGFAQEVTPSASPPASVQSAPAQPAPAESPTISAAPADAPSVSAAPSNDAAASPSTTPSTSDPVSTLPTPTTIQTTTKTRPTTQVTRHTAAPVAHTAPAAVATNSASLTPAAQPKPTAHIVPAAPVVAQPLAPDQTAAPSPQPEIATSQPPTKLELELGGLLILLGLSGGAALAYRRSLRHDAMLIETQTRSTRVAPAEAIPSNVTPAMAKAPAAGMRKRFDTPMNAKTVAQAAEALAVPENAQSHAKLVSRLAAAAPDGANPFLSLSARRKRAHIIIQTARHLQDERAATALDRDPLNARASRLNAKATVTA